MWICTMHKLDAREKVFVDEYLVDLNPERSAIAAGYSKTTARVKSYSWVCDSRQKPHVFEAVQIALQKRSDRTEITQDRVLEEYAKLAFLDPRKFYDDDGRLIDIPNLPAEVAAAISGMDIAVEKAGTDEDGSPIFAQVRKIKLVDKKGALDSVARHLGMFNDKLNLAADIKGEINHSVAPELMTMLQSVYDTETPV
jgi:phage terminase small subunit